MRNALVDRELEHLRVDHDHAHVLGRRLVHQAQHHGVDAHGFARARRAGDQEMRHAREIRNHRHAADILAERQRERRADLVVGLGLDDLPERDDLALLVRDLETDDRFTGNDLDHAHADGGQRARQVLGETADLTDFDAGRRTQLEARDHRPRLHRDDLGLDAEIAQLQLDEPRHGLERLVRVGLLARPRLIEQGQRRQLARLGRIEQRHLALALHPLALLGRGCRSLDARRRPAGHFLLLFANHFLARLLALPAGSELAASRALLADPVDAPEYPSSDLVHDLEPGHAQEQGDACEPQAEQEERRTEQAQALGGALTDELAEHAARGIGKGCPVPVQGRQSAARDEREHEPGRAQQAVRPRAHIRQGLFLVHEPARVREHYREQVRRPAEHE